MQRGRARGETARCQGGAVSEDGDVQRGRTRGDTARCQGDTEHGLLSLVSAREGTGNICFYQAQRHENPPTPTNAARKLFTPNMYVEALDEYSVIWRQAMDKQHHALAATRTVGAM